jgi:histidinol-phosphate aminotransferase
MKKSVIQEMLPSWAGRIKPYVTGKPAEEVERDLGRSARKLASNENPLGPSPRAVEAIEKSLGRVHLYPDSAAHDLRQKLAEYHGVDASQVILGAGSTELIYLAARTFLTPQDESLTSESSFYIYRLAVSEAGAGCRLVPMRDMTFDLGAIRRAVTPRTKVIFIANPNNPTGTMFPTREFESFLDGLPPRVLVVLDEAYYDYVERPDYCHTFERFVSRETLLVLRTFSKVHGLAGLRVGYGIGHSELIAELDRVRPPFDVSRPAQAAAIAALEDGEHVARSVESNRREMKFITAELTLLGIRFTPSVGNFLLIDTTRDCEHDFLRLLEEGVIVRPMKLYDFPTSLRVTIGTHEDNEAFLEGMRRVMGSVVAVAP